MTGRRIELHRQTQTHLRHTGNRVNFTWYWVEVETLPSCITTFVQSVMMKTRTSITPCCILMMMEMNGCDN